MSRSLQLALLASALLSSGCYCPMLSGRYSEVACSPFGAPTPARGCWCDGEPKLAATKAEDSARQEPCAQGHCDSRGHAGRGRGHFDSSSGPMPSRQGPDYATPLAKFHPLPTRPVFEPLALEAPLKAMPR